MPGWHRGASLSTRVVRMEHRLPGPGCALAQRQLESLEQQIEVEQQNLADCQDAGSRTDLSRDTDHT